MMGDKARKVSVHWIAKNLIYHVLNFGLASKVNEKPFKRFEPSSFRVRFVC